MWKKPEGNESESESLQTTPAQPPRRSEVPRKGELATIGSSISIQGDVTGEEDLVIQGRIEGKVDLKQNRVSVGENGRVKADVYARSITVEGEVEGSLFGDEQVVVRQSGRVRGDIVSPRVTLEDGATFKGSIDMEAKSPSRPMAHPAPKPAPAATSEKASEAKPQEVEEPKRSGAKV